MKCKNFCEWILYSQRWWTFQLCLRNRSQTKRWCYVCNDNRVSLILSARNRISQKMQKWSETLTEMLSEKDEKREREKKIECTKNERRLNTFVRLYCEWMNECAIYIFSSNFNHFRFQVFLRSLNSSFSCHSVHSVSVRKSLSLHSLIIFHFSTSIFMDILIIYFSFISFRRKQIIHRTIEENMQANWFLFSV